MAKIINIKGEIIPNDNKWIYDWLGYDSTCPRDVISVLDATKGEEDIIIKMNSGGGSVTVAHEIYTEIVEYIANYNANIEIHVVSLSGSAASEILMACKSKISPVGLVMLHNCATRAQGDYREMDSACQMLQVVNQSIRNAYKAKTGLSDEELKEIMDKTTWMSAEEAVAKGFVDEIMFVEDNDEKGEVTDLIKSSQIAFYNSVSHLKPETINKLRNVLISEKNINTENNKPDGVIETNNQVQQASILNKDNPKNEGGKQMSLQELLKEHPELANEIEQLKVTAKAEGKEEGVKEERTRLQAIDNIANSIPKELVDKAKYSEVMNASELALKVISDSAAAGKEYFTNAITDSAESGANDVTATPSDPADPEDKDEALMNVAVQAANSKRKAVK